MFKLISLGLTGTLLGTLLLQGPLTAQTDEKKDEKKEERKDYIYKVWFEPKAPVLGKSYKMVIEVRNNDPAYGQIFRASVLKLPEKDKLITPPIGEQRVRPLGVATFVFEIQCGSEKGSITYDVQAAWE